MGWSGNRGSFKPADIHGSGYGQGTVNSGHVGMATHNAATGTGAYSTATDSGAARTAGNPVGVLIAVLVLLVLLRFAAGKTGDSEAYGAIAPTAWNILVVTLAAVLGLTLLKAVATKWLPANSALRQIIYTA